MGAVDVVEVVLVGVVLLVAVVVWEAVVAGVPVAWVVVEGVELPHAARSTTSESRTRRFIGRGVAATAHWPCHYPDAHGP